MEEGGTHSRVAIHGETPRDARSKNFRTQKYLAFKKL